MKKLLFFVILCMLWQQAAIAQINIGKNSTIEFASIEEGQKILTAKDEFVTNMSPFDRAAILKTDQDVSEEQYLEFVGKSVLAWNDAEKKKITDSLQKILPRLRKLALPLPEKVLLIKTTGREEAYSAYTRANAIILPQNIIKFYPNIQQLICHELFHVLSRANPQLRYRLYESIGFIKCNEIELPAKLKNKKITNPDAPWHDHYIRLKIGDRECLAVPVIFSYSSKYNVKRGGEFLEYLRFGLLLVEKDENSNTIKPVYKGKKYKIAGLSQVSGFFEQVGKNTMYIIHPEEILADNFAYMILQKPNLQSPEIVQRMEEIIKNFPTNCCKKQNES